MAKSMSHMSVGGQKPGGVRGTPANTTKQEFGSHPGYANEMANTVVDQQATTTMSCSQNESHVGYNHRMQEKDHEVIDSVGPRTNSVEGEREERGTTVRESDSHGMAVGMKRENKEDNTRQYGE